MRDAMTRLRHQPQELAGNECNQAIEIAGILRPDLHSALLKGILSVFSRSLMGPSGDAAIDVNGNVE